MCLTVGLPGLSLLSRFRLLRFGGVITVVAVLSSLVVASDSGNLMGLVAIVLWRRGVKFRRAGDFVILTAGELNGDERVCGDDRSINLFLWGDFDRDLVTTVGPLWGRGENDDTMVMV